MVLEVSPKPHALRIIQDTIATKAWYGLTPGGGFNWPASVGKMTESLQGALSWDRPDLFETVREALETAFTPDCLMRVGEEPFVTKLVTLAHAHGSELIVWTVGDVGWQENKAVRTGIFTRGVARENFRCMMENKRDGLLSILQEIRAQKPTDMRIHVYVLDDKEDHIHEVRSLAADANALNIELHDFYVKDGVLGATPRDAYVFLQKELSHLDDNVVIVSDYDGVIANTDRALKERGAQNIYQAYVSS